MTLAKRIFSRVDRRVRTAAAGCLLIPLAGLVLTACYTNPPKVVVYGDSLATQAESYINFFLGQGNAQVFDNIYPGTAPCSWMNQMLSDATSSVQASAAILSFSGYSGSGCMTGYQYGTEPYYIKYESDTQEAVNAFVANGTHVFLVGYPIDYSDVTQDGLAMLIANPEWDILNQIYQQIAAQDPSQVTFIDAGGAVMTEPTNDASTTVGSANTGYAWYLPCLSFEPQCNVGGPLGPAPPGENAVRQSDGVHFCPGTPIGLGNTCSVYASGAFRYGLAIAGPVDKFLDQ